MLRTISLANDFTIASETIEMFCLFSRKIDMITSVGDTLITLSHKPLSKTAWINTEASGNAVVWPISNPHVRPQIRR